MKLRTLIASVCLGLLFLCTVALPIVAMSQDTAVIDSTGTGGDTDTPDSGTGVLSENLLLVFAAVLGIYEVLARLIPTVKNWSIVSAIMEILKKLLPNKKADPITKEKSGEFKT